VIEFVSDFASAMPGLTQRNFGDTKNRWFGNQRYADRTRKGRWSHLCFFSRRASVLYALKRRVKVLVSRKLPRRLVVGNCEKI